ncbi:MAG: GFA family protein [Myxococcales bacterium]|nr:GFA family protein [Myxococcales bacterium]
MSDELRAGGCHCGQVRFEVSGPLDEILDCNCSICTKKGFLHWIVAPSRFRQLSGVLATYTFGTHSARHMFCPTCGMHPFYTPRSHPDHVDVNVRCLDGIEIEKLTIRPFDGRGDWEKSRAALDEGKEPQPRRRS